VYLLCRRQDGLREIPGLVPVLSASSDACTFAERCSSADEQCRSSRPPFERGPAGHPVACWHPVGVPQLWRAGT